MSFISYISSHRKSGFFPLSGDHYVCELITEEFKKLYTSGDVHKYEKFKEILDKYDCGFNGDYSKLALLIEKKFSKPL